MSKMPFLPYLRMHTLNLESTSDSEFNDVRDDAETTHTRSRSDNVDESVRTDHKDGYAASDVSPMRFARR